MINKKELEDRFNYVMKKYSESARVLNYSNSDLARNEFEKWHKEKMKLEGKI